MGVGVTGLNATGYAVNILDIAPKYAGVIIGISNVFGSMPGFISPQIVGFITTKNTAAEWQVVFWITAVIYGIGVVFFFFSVSGEKQPWADGVDAEHKENVPYSNSGHPEEKEPLLNDKGAEEDKPASSEGQQEPQPQDGEETKQ